MNAAVVSALFVVLHATLLLVRLARLNGYGPCAIVFMTFVDVFFAVPVYLDLFVGPPDYGAFAGITTAANSGTVLVLYCTIVLGMTAAFIAFLGPLDAAERAPVTLSPRALASLTLLTYLPPVYVLASGQLEFYRRYAPLLTGADLQPGGIQAVVGFINVTGVLLGLSVVAGGLIIRFTRGGALRGLLPLLLAAPALMVDVWLMSKRSIVAFLVLLIGVSILDRARHRFRLRHGVLGLAMAIGLVLFSSAYQRALRPDTQESPAAAYANYRIDMGRDHDLKLVLHDELDGSVPPILDYRLQSFLFVAAMLVPREVWAGKPWPFAVYLTSAALEVPVRELGWGITTDLFSESVANLGLLGLIPCCLFFIWAVRRIDRSGDPVLVILGSLSVCSLVVLQIGAVAIWHLSLLAYLAYTRLWRSRERAA
jgi:hypothetical protein